MTAAIAKRNPKRPPRQVYVEHVPTPKLARAIRDLQEGRFVEYASVEAVRADIEQHKKSKHR